MTDLSDEALLAELGVSVEPVKTGGRSAREERIIAGFEDIQRFYEVNGRVPQHGEECDIFERLYAVRLDRLRVLPEAKELLAGMDVHGLLALSSGQDVPDNVAALDDGALLEKLAGEQETDSDITVLRHVRSQQERQSAEEIASRALCRDFDQFKPLFEQVESDRKTGTRQTRPFGKDASINTGDWFILGGQIAYVAEIGETIRAPNGENDARLRVIYSNGMESNLLRRSLQRALYKDEAGRRLTDPNVGPLFAEIFEDDDIESGIIYVLRSQSDHPFVAEHRELIHKIGVTSGKVETRIANAAHDATYLLADVEVIATYQLSRINRTKLENLLHRIFSPAQLDLTIQDRFGHPVRPREWFLAPLHVIDEAIRRICDGSITDVIYDSGTASLVEVGTKLYFAYGSNMWVEQMQNRCPNHRFVGCGVLRDYRWIISSRCYANIVKSPQSKVMGTVYRISESDERSLDKHEGVAKGDYRKETLNIELNGSYQDCLVYIDPIEGEGTPKPEYIKRINKGIEDARLPHDYVQNSIRRFVPKTN